MMKLHVFTNIHHVAKPWAHFRALPFVVISAFHYSLVVVSSKKLVKTCALQIPLTVCLCVCLFAQFIIHSSRTTVCSLDIPNSTLLFCVWCSPALGLPSSFRSRASFSLPTRTLCGTAAAFCLL
uniref:(northern house mosquito) hypothetical protein n=1 Tax=Culex pipiens TaxID=7175 RepID=A0A8D8FPC8_CULPI